MCFPVVKGYGLYKQGRDLCISFFPDSLDFELTASSIDGIRLCVYVCACV